MGTSSNLTQKSLIQAIGCEKFQTKRKQQSNFSKFQVFCPIFQTKKFLFQSFLGVLATALYTSVTDSPKFLTRRYTTGSRPILRRQSMVNVSAESRPIHRPRFLPTVGRYVDHHSADIRRSISRPTYLGRHIDRHIDRHSTDMLTDTSVESRSICRPIYRSRGAQNTHDPNFVPNNFIQCCWMLLNSNKLLNCKIIPLKCCSKTWTPGLKGCYS